LLFGVIVFFLAMVDCKKDDKKERTCDPVKYFCATVDGVVKRFEKCPASTQQVIALGKSYCTVQCDTATQDEILRDGFVVACATKCAEGFYRPTSRLQDDGDRKRDKDSKNNDVQVAKCRPNCKDSEGNDIGPPPLNAKGNAYGRCPTVCDGAAIEVLSDDQRGNSQVARCAKLRTCQAGESLIASTKDATPLCAREKMCDSDDDDNGAAKTEAVFDGEKVKCVRVCPSNMKRMVLDKKISCVSTCPDVKGDGIGETDGDEVEDRKRKNGKNCAFRFSDRVIQFGPSGDSNGDGIPDCCRSDRDHDENRKRDGGRRLPCDPNDAEYQRLLQAKGLTTCPAAPRCADDQVRQTDPLTLTTSCVSRAALCSLPTPPIHCNVDDDNDDDNDDDEDDLHDCCDDDKRKRDGGTREKCRLAGVICACDGENEISVNGVCVEFENCQECNAAKTAVCGIQANRCDLDKK